MVEANPPAREIPKELDKQSFTKKISLVGLRTPVKQIGHVLNELKQNGDLAFTRPKTRLRSVIECDRETKIVLLAESVRGTDTDALPDVVQRLARDLHLEVVQRDVDVRYEDMNYEEVMSHVLPAHVQTPMGFEQIGHIVHFNLTPEQIPYQHLIGQAIIDRNKQTRTVVNKTEKLHNVYRTPELCLMAGEHTYETEVIEGGCRFQLNFESVYWNSRNQHDRDRVLEYVQPGETVLDLFCGIGPFAIRAAKKGCKVIANDLNPACYEYLVKNAKTNSVDYNMLCYNDDARRVARNFVTRAYLDANGIAAPYRHFDHVYMNLPVLAIDFLDVFRGLLRVADATAWNENNLPLIHVYGFVKGNTDEECHAALVQRINNSLPHVTVADVINFEHTKNVTIRKRMYCVTFRLKKEDALMEPFPDGGQNVHAPAVNAEDDNDND